MKDPVTKRSRGFGFVKFMKPESAAKVSAKGKDHYVDGKKVINSIDTLLFHVGTMLIREE